MRIGLAQINSTLGDFENNAKKILENIQRAKEKKCDLLIFPEATLFGYHPFDMLERSEIVEKQLRYIKTIAEKIPKSR